MGDTTVKRWQQVFEPGTLVQVDPFDNDGFSGLFTILREMPRYPGDTPGRDYYVARGDWSHNPDFAVWDCIMNNCRMTPQPCPALISSHDGKRCACYRWF